MRMQVLGLPTIGNYACISILGTKINNYHKKTSAFCRNVEVSHTI